MWIKPFGIRSCRYNRRGRKGSLVYRVPELLCCRMIGSPPPLFPWEMSPPLSFYSLEVQYNSPTLAFGGRGWVAPNNTTVQKFWYSIYQTHFTGETHWRSWFTHCLLRCVQKTGPAAIIKIQWWPALQALSGQIGPELPFQADHIWSQRINCIWYRRPITAGTTGDQSRLVPATNHGWCQRPITDGTSRIITSGTNDQWKLVTASNHSWYHRSITAGTSDQSQLVPVTNYIWNRRTITAGTSGQLQPVPPATNHS